MEYIITLIPDWIIEWHICKCTNTEYSYCVMYQKQSVFLIIILYCVIFPRQTQNQTVCWKSFKGNLSIYVIIL